MTYDICKCNCHTDGSIHFGPCCQGDCEGCGKWVFFGMLDRHRQNCPDWLAWAKKQKRSTLRQKGII